MLKGIGASQGFGIGKAVVIKDINLDYSFVKFTDSEHQKKRLRSAVADFSDETKALAAELKKNAGEKEAEILEGHLVMLEDPFMLSQMEEAIDNGSVAEAAADSVCTMFIDMFSGVDDELTRQRASDVKDIRDSYKKKAAELAAKALFTAEDITDDYRRSFEITSGPFILNTRNRTLEKDCKRLKLTQIEYQLMKLFMENPGKAMSRDDILRAVWGDNFSGELKTVDVNIRRLRIKIEADPTEPEYLTTVWGFGYKWGY